MPLYEYECQKCGRRTEKIESVDGPYLRKCPHCGGKVERLVTAPAIQFKGAGWYVTDYANKSSSGDSEKSAPGATEGAGKESAKEKSGDSKETVSKDSKEKKSAKKK